MAARARRELPRALLAELCPVDDDLVAERYREALGALGIEAPERRRFHLDAAGYSPEVAADLGDPLYLGSGPLSARAVLVSVEQLGSPQVHPSFGWAAEAYRKLTGRWRREIAKLTLREPLLIEGHTPAEHFAEPQALADVAHFELRVRTPGGLVQGVRRLEAMRKEFLASERLWLDDAYIEKMLEVADRVRDLGGWTEGFATSEHPLGLFYTPAFGGAYVLEEPGAGGRGAITHVLCGEPGDPASEAERRSARGRRVVLKPLAPGPAADLLEGYGVGRLDVDALRREPRVIEQIRHWIAVSHLGSRDPERSLTGLDLRELLGSVRSEGDPPEDHLEFEDIARRVASTRGILDPEGLSPLARLRLLRPTSKRPAVRDFVLHAQAALDPAHLDRQWLHARDVFFARIGSLEPGRREYFAHWLRAAGPR